jgi:hypothetical protein
MKPDEFFALMMGLYFGMGLAIISAQSEVKKDAGTSDIDHNRH